MKKRKKMHNVQKWKYMQKYATKNFVTFFL